eukprot:jgi/Astpho2/4005/fgenesh1_pm.00063_%23_17_t
MPWPLLSSPLVAGSSLIIAEHKDSQLSPATRNAAAAATQLKDVSETTMLVAGQNIGPVAEAASKVQGISHVLTADATCLQHQLAEPTAELIAAVQRKRKFSHIWAPSTTFGRNVLPRAAALLDVQQVSDVTEVLDADTFVRPIYAGNALETVKHSSPGARLLTVRTTAFEAASGQGSAVIAAVSSEELDAAQKCSISTQWVEESQPQTERPELSAAKLVVAGGRALKTPENFRLLEELADRLGGAVGASRAAVDAGLCPNDMQVGQTGKVVAPQLYIAIGISGAIQHLAGMKDSKVIVAINSDPDAPIFQVADLGLVGDLFKILPELLKQLPKTI